MNRERLIADAKATALQRVTDGYRAPLPRMAIPVGGESLGAALKLGVHLAWRAGRATDHDRTIGRALAHVFAGGDLPHATTVTEQHLLDLEREAFLRLLGEPKTLARIQHTLKTGKPLRNWNRGPHHPARRRTAHRARARHPGTLRVGAAHGGCARRTRPRHHVLALRRADERLRVDRRGGLRELPHAARRRAARDRRRAAGARGRARTAASIAAEYAARHPGALCGPRRRLGAAAGVDAAGTGAALPGGAAVDGAGCSGSARPVRVYPELKAAFPGGRDRWQFVVDHGLRIAGAPASSARMARRLRWLDGRHGSP